MRAQQEARSKSLPPQELQGVPPEDAVRADARSCKGTAGFEAVGLHRDRYVGGTANEQIMQDVTYLAADEPVPNLCLFDLQGCTSAAGLMGAQTLGHHTHTHTTLTLRI